MMDFYGFYRGQIFDAYEYLGAHPTEKGTVFRTYAPNARGACVLWNDQQFGMDRIGDGHFYELYIEGAKPGDAYEYRIYRQDDTPADHCDPYGFGMELRPNHKSIIRDLKKYKFHDEKWMKQRNDRIEGPLNIYELHMGSWKKPGDEPDDWYRYDELAEPLVKYLKESGYNYVEFLPLAEHPCDESWGYQNTGFYAPTSRYGTGADLMKLVDTLHKHGIGAILDFVPVHFALDDYALGKYDGTELYEYPSCDIGVSEWGSYNFIHSRGEVRTFLQSAANYWLKEYHFDGLRMDAISRIIYWAGDEKRGVNGNALDLLKVMNMGLKRINPGCMLIAEDSTNYPNVTRSVEEGGLGFDYKWDMGWMHDTLEYFQTGFEYRSANYHKLTFSMMYFRNERFLLPYSHDEVVHGKATIAQKMSGEYELKFPQARAMYLYMMVHPGKKLNFMGNEIAQLREWDEKREQDWDMRKYPLHDSFYQYICELNEIYLQNDSLWAWDYQEAGFDWLDCHQEARCIYAIERRSEKERMIAVFNFSDKEQKGYQVYVPGAQKMELMLDSNWERFSGTQEEGKEGYLLEKEMLTCDLKPFSGVLWKVTNE